MINKPQSSIAKHFEQVCNPPDIGHWTNINSIAMVEVIREQSSHTSRAGCFYISSLAPDTQQLATAIRTRGVLRTNGIASSMSFLHEGDSRICIKRELENPTVLKHLECNPFSQEKIDNSDLAPVFISLVVQ